MSHIEKHKAVSILEKYDHKIFNRMTFRDLLVNDIMRDLLEGIRHTSIRVYTLERCIPFILTDGQQIVECNFL